MKDKKKIIMIISVIALLLIASGVAYAYFSAQITGEESSTTVNVTGGSMSLAVNGGNSISISNVIPSSDVLTSKTFTVTGNNTTTLTIPYNISLVVETNTFATGALTYTLTSTNTSANGDIVPSISSQVSLYTGSRTILLGNGSFDNGSGSIHTYVLNVYFPDTGTDQNANQGKSFSAYISIASGQAEDSTTPTLLDTRILGANNSKVSATLTTPGKESALGTEAVLASATDNYGTSYYYRGSVENNYIVFANMCWRIVRITGNGAIKLALYNYNPNSLSNPCSETGASYAFARYSGDTYTTSFNTNANDNTYVGLMYGATGASTYADAQANTNKSTVLTNLETWYTSKLSSYSSYLADVIWCNEKKISYGTGYSGASTYYFGSRFVGLNTTNVPPTLDATKAVTGSFMCYADTSGGTLSKFTVDDITNGNGALTYPIGLLTINEVVMAGAKYLTPSSFYLGKNASSNSWWTMSPIGYTSAAYEFSYGMQYGINETAVGLATVSYANALRPAVALKSTTQVTGLGTAADPYYIVE